MYKVGPNLSFACLFYCLAVKCNDNELVLKTLASLGTGFDCASKNEIKKVIDLGVTDNRIIFANPTKPRSHIIYGSSVGVKTMTFDSESELIKVKQFCPDAKLVLRIRCDAKSAQCPLGEKYGCDPTDEAESLIELAYKLQLNIVGISFHVGSGCTDLLAYKKAIYHVSRLFAYAKNQFNIEMDLLDIGGGFPGDRNTSIADVAEIINEALDEYFPSDKSAVKIIAEPGRFFVASAFTLVCRVHSIREKFSQNGEIKQRMYFINDGVYGSFNCNLYDHNVPVPKLLRDIINQREGYETISTNDCISSIWGPTCDALDQVVPNVVFPKLDIGEIIIFENMGAYTLPIASAFNGFPLPTVDYFVDQKHWNTIKHKVKPLVWKNYDDV